MMQCDLTVSIGIPRRGNHDIMLRDMPRSELEWFPRCCVCFAEGAEISAGVARPRYASESQERINTRDGLPRTRIHE
jgi:hypothetical protein